VSDEQVRRLGHAVLDESAEELYEHAPCGYVSCLPDGTILRVNQTLLDWTGYTREYLLADTRVQSLLSVGSKIYYETHFAPLMQMQGRANEIALEIIGADRTARPILVNAVQKRDADGTPLFMRMTLFDATDRRRYERELLVARRRAEQIAADKADLLAMLSHDIRNPLNALMGNVFMLERSNLAEEHMRRLRVVRSASENMLALLNRVLELSKAESAAFALAESSFALAALVREAAGAFAARAEEKGLRLDVTIAGDVPETVIGDPIALRQILSNFIGNAVKFTERGSVSVSVRALELATDAVTLKFMVIDTGIGIPADRVERIFEEFTQGSDDTAVRYGGSGLGLAIARKLLALYGSSIQLESAPGEGSAFAFKLRLAVPRTLPANAP
jgi:PAS domain S-box-containing protein